MISTAFPPIETPEAQVLVLGSLPGTESLRLRQYYGKQANRFWWIMGHIAGAKPELPYGERVEALKQARIAVWDVCAAAVRPGSLDASIVPDSVVANDFQSFLARHGGIGVICFNGAKAAALFTRVALPLLGPAQAAIRREILPSTSPAHATMRRSRNWRFGGG